MDTNTDEGSIDTNSSAESYTTGMASGAGATPFKYDGGDNATNVAYVGKDGYLYGSGINYNGALGTGSASISQSSFVKVGTSTSGGASSLGFKNPIDYSFSAHNGIVIASTGKVWTSGYNNNGNLGQGDTTTDYFFTQVSTGTGTNDLPSTYKAVGVSSSYMYTSMILTSDGYLYGAGGKEGLGLGSGTQSTFTRMDGVAGSGALPAHSTSNPIIDFVASSVQTKYSYVLYKNGDLYRLYSSTATRIATSITMFDCDNYSSPYLYAVTSANKINIYNNSGSLYKTVTPTGTVTQVRGASISDGGWGYLNSAGDLYLSSSSSSTAPGKYNSTATGTTFYKISNVAYFDLTSGASFMKYAILTTSGAMKVWGDNRWGELGNGTTESELDYSMLYGKLFNININKKNQII